MSPAEPPRSDPSDQDPTVPRALPADEPTVRRGASGPQPAAPHPSDATPAPLAGTPFGRYLLQELLGRGGMGAVWKTWDTSLRRVVALKQLLGNFDSTLVERFQRESQAAARLHHPGIVQVYDVGTEGGQHYFTAEYIDAKPLDKLIGTLSLRRAVEVVRGVAEALQYAHSQGIVHRDVKPSNVLIDTEGRPHLADFGLAKDLAPTQDHAITVSGEMLGTPSYMSPEQATGARDVGPASDQFSLGVLLYELIAGRRPFAGSGFADLVQSIRTQDPELPSRFNRRVPRDLETICMRALEKDPARRFPAVGELAADLGRWLAGEPIHARPVSSVERLWRKTARHWRIAVPSGIAVLLAVALIPLFIDIARSKARQQAERENALAAVQRAMADKGNMDEAMKLLESGRIAIDRASRCLYEKDVEFEELSQKVEVAQAAIDAALAKAPDLVLAYHLRGRAWQLRGWDEKAEADWRTAIRLDPEFGPSHFMLGKLLADRSFYWRTGRTDFKLADRRRESTEIAGEARSEIERSLSARVGVEDPLQLVVAKAICSRGLTDDSGVLSIVDEALAKYGTQAGTEDLWLLRSYVGPTTELRKDLDQAISVRPKFPMALFTRAEYRAQDGDVAGAFQDLEEAIRIHPRFVEAYRHRAVLEVEKKDYDKAKADLDAALAIDPQHVLSLVGRACVWNAQCQFPYAIKDCDAALALEPRCVAALVTRGCSWFGAGDAQKALADADAALAIEPEEVDALGNRGIAKRCLGDYDGAIADFGSALAIRPGAAETTFDRAMTWWLRAQSSGAEADWARAAEDFGRAMVLAPHDGRPRRERARMRMARHDLDGALADLQAAIEIDSKDAKALILRAAGRRVKQDPDGAIADLEAAVAVEPSNASTWFDLGSLRFGKKELDGAMAAWEEVIRLEPDFFEAWCNRGNIRAMKGDFEGAAADFRKALELAPPDWDFRHRAEEMLQDVERRLERGR